MIVMIEIFSLSNLFFELKSHCSITEAAEIAVQVDFLETRMLCLFLVTS